MVTAATAVSVYGIGKRRGVKRGLLGGGTNLSGNCRLRATEDASKKAEPDRKSGAGEGSQEFQVNVPKTSVPQAGALTCYHISAIIKICRLQSGRPTES